MHCFYNERANRGHVPREGLPVCRANAVLLFLSYFKTPPPPFPLLEATTYRSAVKRSNDWANAAAVKSTYSPRDPTHPSHTIPIKKDTIWINDDGPD